MLIREVMEESFGGALAEKLTILNGVFYRRLNNNNTWTARSNPDPI
jgi:hypothetical protein